MAVPHGIIVIWSGAIVTIPAGWILCDGNNGTPDLRGRFIPGAGEALDPGDTGGANTHTHAFTSDGHSHEAAGGTGLQGGLTFDTFTSEETDEGTTDAASSLPSYYALAYIMKT